MRSRANWVAGLGYILAVCVADVAAAQSTASPGLRPAPDRRALLTVANHDAGTASQAGSERGAIAVALLALLALGAAFGTSRGYAAGRAHPATVQRFAMVWRPRKAPR